jgi:hypothetical protein
MKKITAFCILLIVLFLVAGCTAGPNRLAGTPDGGGEVARFPMGLWHGLIAPVAFIVSLFSDTVTIYEVHNNGGWYNFGFILGMMIILGGGGGGAARRRR